MIRSWNSLPTPCTQLVSGTHLYTELLFWAVSSPEGFSNAASSGVQPVTVCILRQSMVCLASLSLLVQSSHIDYIGEGHIRLNRLFRLCHRNAWRLIQALSAQIVSWLHTRHCKHKLCNLSSSYCTWDNKPCCAAMCATFHYHRAQLGSLQTWLGHASLAPGIGRGALVCPHPSVLAIVRNMPVCSLLWGHWRICAELWQYSSQKALRVCVCILQIFSYHLCPISLLLRYLICCSILNLSSCSTICIDF